MRIHTPKLLLICAIISVSGCATQSSQRSGPTRRVAAPVRQMTPMREPALSPQIDYHADPPKGPHQPVPAPPVAEAQELEVKGVGLSRVIHDVFDAPECGDDPCVDESANCTSAEPCGETSDCGEKSCFKMPSMTRYFRMPKYRLPKVRLPKYKLPKYKLPRYRLPSCRLPGLFCSSKECAEVVTDGCNTDDCLVECSPGDTCSVDGSCAEGCSTKSSWTSRFKAYRMPSLFDKCFSCFKPRSECGEQGCTDSGCGASVTAEESQLKAVPAQTLDRLIEDPFVDLPEQPVPEIPLTPETLPEATSEPVPLQPTPIPQQPAQPAQPAQPPVSPETAGVAPAQKPVLAPLAPMPVTKKSYVVPQIWPRLKYTNSHTNGIQGRPTSWQSQSGGTTTWQIR